MAHLAKFKSGDSKRIFAESDRTMSDLVYELDENGKKRYVLESERKDKKGKRYKNYVDPDRSHLNYNFVPADGLTTQERLEKRLSEVDYKGKIPFSEVNVMGSWIFTKPKGFDGDEDLLFREFYNFNGQRYGFENIIDAHVHKDETNNHTGVRVAPVVKYIDKKTGEEREKLSAKQVFTKEDLRTYHQDLSRHMEQVFGYDVGVLLEDDDPNKNGDLTLDEYKFAEQRKKEDENAKNAVNMRVQELDLSRERKEFEEYKQTEREAIGKEWEAVSEARAETVRARQALETATETMRKQAVIYADAAEEHKDAIQTLSPKDPRKRREVEGHNAITNRVRTGVKAVSANEADTQDQYE